MPTDPIAWGIEHLGPGARVIERGRGEEAELWHLRGPRGEAWLKRHRHAAKAAREHAMLGHLAPHLEGAIPAVLGVREPDVLLLSACGGRPVDLDALDPARRAAVLRQAGAFLSRLGTVPLPEHDADPLPLHQAYALRIDRWLARAAKVLSASRVATLRRELHPRVLEGATRRLCHRDFRPDNWIVTADDPPALFVIDFGQARPDDWLVDLAKLDPDDLGPVLEGFGRDLDDAERARLRVLRALHELATETWAASR